MKRYSCESCAAWVSTAVAVLVFVALVLVLAAGQERMSHSEFVVVRNVLGVAFGLSGCLSADRWRALHELRRRRAEPRR